MEGIAPVVMQSVNSSSVVSCATRASNTQLEASFSGFFALERVSLGRHSRTFFGSADFHFVSGTFRSAL